jgi:hypothetical protein
MKLVTVEPLAKEPAVATMTDPVATPDEVN